jgi:hypothetical protein
VFPWFSFGSDTVPRAVSSHSFRGVLAGLREEGLLEKLEAIAKGVEGYGWRLENLEVS